MASIALPINQEKVDEFVRQCKHYNEFPIFLPWFLHENGVHPLCGPLCDLVKDCLQYLSSMHEDEMAIIIDNFPEGIKLFLEHEGGTKKPYPLDRVALYYVINLVSEKYLSFEEVICSGTKDSEVLKIYPELEPRFDKDGLMRLDHDLTLSDGGIFYKEHVLHYHQFLRRGYLSNPNFDFLGRFAHYYSCSNSKNDFRIAIDHSRIMPKEWFKHIMERDTWYGPRFDRSRLDDPNYTGMTLVKRNKNSLFERTNHLDRTEFYWSYTHKEKIKTFEVEEISSEDFLYQNYYLNRYVHSERNIERKFLRHFDGSVKVYLKDDYQERFGALLPKEPKCFRKIKLFRIDGDIDIERWIELISFFYKSNEMIIEYFNPTDFEQIFEERVRDYKAWKEKQTN